ncbi:hypothetical protein AgCh_010995 [Apium graveolens]
MAATSRWGNQPTDEEREKIMKVKKAEKALQKVQDYLEPSSLPNDLATLSDKERFLFHKIGLGMKPFLLLGLGGIFDGTIDNMHLHWKYRELVKVIVDGKRFAQVKHIAIALEAESGGVLVSAMRPKNLLTRRQALARSIELQRREEMSNRKEDTFYSRIDDASDSDEDDDDRVNEIDIL